MPRINVTSSFDVIMPDGRVIPVRAGESDVPDEVATHWFVKAHGVGADKQRNVLVQGEHGMLIEADESGQRTTAPFMLDAASQPLRQEGPFVTQNAEMMMNAPKDAPKPGMEPDVSKPEPAPQPMMSLPAKPPVGVKPA